MRKNIVSRSTYQHCNMAPRISIFRVVSFLSKCLLGSEGQKKLENYAILSRQPRKHVRILIYRTWPIITQSCPRHFPLLFCSFHRFTYISTHLFNSYSGKLTWTLASGQTEF